MIVRRTPDGATTDVTPMPFNVRTTVHEYGGRCSVIDGDTVYFSNFADQRLLPPADRLPAQQPLTPEANLRYADPVVDRSRNRLICVREDRLSPRQRSGQHSGRHRS